MKVIAHSADKVGEYTIPNNKENNSKSSSPYNVKLTATLLVQH